MKNPIGNIGLFATPKDMKYLENWLGAHTGPEAAHIWTGAMMAWNLAGKYTKEAIEAEADAKAELSRYGARAYRDAMNGGA